MDLKSELFILNDILKNIRGKMSKKIFLSLVIIMLSSQLFSQSNLVGLYFSNEYIESLLETKNHYLAMRNTNKDVPQALIIEEKEDELILLEVWNFHEGTTRKLNRQGSIIYEGDFNKYILINNQITEEIENISYTKISDIPNREGFNSYVITQLFPAGEYISDIGYIVAEGMSLNINSEEYEITLDTAGYINKTNLTIFRNRNNQKKYAFDVINHTFTPTKWDEIILLLDGNNSYSYYDNMKSISEPQFLLLARLGCNSTNYENEYSAEQLHYLNSLTKGELRLFRNALFALHGYEFRSEDLQDYFSDYSWYTPDGAIQNSLSLLTKQQQNLFEIIRDFESRE